MSQDDIISMAQEAGFMQHLGVIAVPGIHCLERFAELVVAAEREACIDVLMRLHEMQGEQSHNYYHYAANQIREMGKENT